MQRLMVRPQGRGAVLSSHPWILADSLIKPANPPRVGEVVELVDMDGRTLGTGLYHPTSRIAVRRYGNESNEVLDSNFFIKRLHQACDLRDQAVFHSARHGLRLVFSEGDQCSGLIVDRYGDYAVVQQTSAALTAFIPAMAEAIRERYALRGILHTIDASTAKLEGLEATRTWLVGDVPSEPIEIEENGLRWTIDLERGQKTGYYHDQRDNRLACSLWMPVEGKILDVCCYLGGFALNIAKQRPKCTVLGLDASEHAIVAAVANAGRNELDNVAFQVGDFIQSLEGFLEKGECFGGIVLDPPKMAGSRDSIERALRAYHRMNYLAVRLLQPGGILVTCSCSGRITRTDFWNMLRGVSKQAKRPIQILEQRGAAPDHPVLATCPETDYLKCFICRVG